MTGVGVMRTWDPVGRPSLERIQRLVVAAGLRATGSTPFTVALERGVEVEKSVRRGLETYQEFLGRALGFASRREVRRLQEVVRALEHRLEEFDEAPSPPTRRRPRG
jgi:hypothetical protein